MSARILTWGFVGAALVIALLIWLDGPPTPQFSQTSASGAQPGPADTTPQLVGTALCAGRGCHGSIDPVKPADKDHRVLQDEFTKWVMRDKHADAFQVLSNQRSKDIAERLGLGKASEEPRCLACHTNPLAAGSLQEISDGTRAHVLREERFSGVGCESCHGAASKWLEPHKKHAWKKDLNPAALRKIGWMSMDDMAMKADTCAGCHVGAPSNNKIPARDVNHDLIAAGHPRLDFEFAAFLANMPPHWNERARPKRPAAEAKVWAIGQVTSAEAALRLLEYRAKPKNKRPWPEFAEYDCFACHHDLGEPSWRQTRGYGNRMPGSLSWGSWYFSMPRALAGEKEIGDSKVVSVLDGLGKEMRKPFPNRGRVCSRASAAAKQLQKWQKKLARKDGPLPVRQMLRVLVMADPKNADAGWDRAEQLYLAAVALSQAQGQKEFARTNRDLTSVRAFPQGFDSPHLFEPAKCRRELRKSLGLPAEKSR